MASPSELHPSGYGVVPIYLMLHAETNKTDVSVYAAVTSTYNYRSQRGPAPLTRITDRGNVRRSTAQDSLAKLEDLGFLQVEKRPGRPSLFAALPTPRLQTSPQDDIGEGNASGAEITPLPIVPPLPSEAAVAWVGVEPSTYAITAMENLQRARGDLGASDEELVMAARNLRKAFEAGRARPSLAVVLDEIARIRAAAARGWHTIRRSDERAFATSLPSEVAALLDELGEPSERLR